MLTLVDNALPGVATDAAADAATAAAVVAAAATFAERRSVSSS